MVPEPTILWPKWARMSNLLWAMFERAGIQKDVQDEAEERARRQEMEHWAQQNAAAEIVESFKTPMHRALRRAGFVQ